MATSRFRAMALVGLAGVLVALPGCQESGQGTTQVEFKGRVVTSKNQPVNTFTLSVGLAPAPAQMKSVTVTTKNGQYQTHVALPSPAVAGSKTLGSKTEGVAIQVSAPGYKTKTFKVTADQVLVTAPNMLNVTLEPSQ